MPTARFSKKFIIHIEPSFGRREMNEMIRIILEYTSIILFGSFNGWNEKSIPLFDSLSER